MEAVATTAQTKRLLEWWLSSARFRRLLLSDPERARQEYQLGIDPELVRPLWDRSWTPDSCAETASMPPAVRAYQDYLERRTRHRTGVMTACCPDEPRFRKWRARQIGRNALEGFTRDIIHAPLAIELTEGCSVGCWFCGVGAGGLVDTWRYTPEHAAVWRDVLAVLRDTIGGAAQRGFCYWATDPLDNPDYERFALDFCDVVGLFPSTTTAQPLNNPARTRRLLALSSERGCSTNRFSILSEGMLRRVCDEFSADELIDVEMVPVMRDSLIPKADSGAFRLRARNQPKLLDHEQRKVASAAELPGTIACVSGFLLNMPRRRVQLVSPCQATDRWPLGYIVFSERSFTSAADLARALEAMSAACMPLVVPSAEVARLNPVFSCAPSEAGCDIVTPTTTVRVQQPQMPAYVASIVSQLREGKKSPRQIAFAAFYEHGVSEHTTLETIDHLFDRGVLAEAVEQQPTAGPESAISG